MQVLFRSAHLRWSALQVELGKQMSERLFREVANKPIDGNSAQSSSLSCGVAIAYIGATFVYLASIALGGLGVWILVGPWNTIFHPIVGVALLLLCLASRPRSAGPPDYILARSDYPTLYTVTDRIATAMRTDPVYAIAMSSDFGANYRQAGWRGSRYIELGAPLMAILNNDERLAVIAHELSHGANRDPLRSRFLYGALNALVAWATAIRPLSIGKLGERMALGPFISLLAIPIELAMLVASEMGFLAAHGFMLLVLRQSQRAEYLADRLASSVAGTQEMEHALEKTYLADVVDAAVRTHALTTPDEPLRNKLSLAIAAVTQDHLIALRSESRASMWQVDTTHPPTALRVELLRIAPAPKLAGLTTQEDSEALDRELARMVAACQREMVNRKLEAAFG